MKSLITLIVLIAMGALLVWQYQSQYHALENRQQHAQDASVSQESQTRQDCADKTAARVRMLGLEHNMAATSKSNFNAQLNQCYALIGSSNKSLDTTWTHLTLYDADGKVFASYEWHSQSDLKPTDVPPFTCDVTLPSGETHTCTSEAEFRNLVGVYMK